MVLNNVFVHPCGYLAKRKRKGRDHDGSEFPGTCHNWSAAFSGPS